MITSKEKLIEMLMDCGMSLGQANPIVDLTIPVIDKQAQELGGIEETDGELLPVNPYKISWNSPSDQYPKALYSVWFMIMKPIALKWIDENKPQAWFREMFVEHKTV